MSKEIYISSTPHETRLAIVENDALTEIYYERENEYTLAGSIYNGKVTRVLPGMQSSFVDIGLERDAFLYITDFMEEAGDSADFEASANSGDHARTPRIEAGRGDGRARSDRGDRGDRGDRAPRETQPRVAEPTDADLFTEAVSGLDPARPVSESERERSGGRRGGRNRRDRNVNSDGTPRREPTDVIRTEVPPVASDEIISAPEPAEDLGEGSTGADGSRRWRGRRGRRGNRGREESAQPVVAAEVRTPSAATGPVYDSYPVAAEETFDIEAAPTVTEPAPLIERGDRGERSGRGGRDRKRGGREDRGDRSVQQPPRAPRGFAPSASLYKVDSSADETLAPVYGAEQTEAPIEPIILPGESLSKYRPGGNVPAESRAEAIPAPASSEFIARGWDGGAVLPGETIRPRGPVADSGSESRSRDDRGGRDSRGGDRNRNEPGGRKDRGGRNDRNDRGPRSDRNDRNDRPQASERVLPETVPFVRAAEHTPAEQTPSEAPVSHVQEQVEPTYLSNPESVPPSHLVTPLNSTFVPPPPMPYVEDVVAAPVEVAPAEALHVEHEFEPSEGSASYRVDPLPLSEYRQSAPLVEEQSPREEHQHVDHVDVPLAEHQLTAISDTGNMYSDVAAHELPPHELSLINEPEPTSPIVYETAVVSADPAESAPSFAPGTGVLEEEMLEDDEEVQTLPISNLNASVGDAYDSHDQETLEGTADLGTMLREMSIDHITRTEPTVDEDDDEDFLEEDQDYIESEEDESGEESNESEEAEESEGADELEHPQYADGEGEHASSETQNVATPAGEAREPRREGRREDRARRDARRGDRNRRPGDRDRNASSDRGFSSPGSDRPAGERDRSNDRDRGSRRDGRGGRQSMQSTNLPAISELLKPGQEILCQIAKEPMAKKGARITSHIALPGRFLVFMPTVHHTGVSRKIESDAERRRLKEILLSEKGEAPGGFIVRTAASGASEEELRSDLRFLLNLWSDIKTRSESSKSPALIYHDLNLVERVLRDQVTDTFSAIWVDTETEYERVLRFLQRFQPSLIRRVKLYTKETPLFEQFGITEEINKALRSKVWLKSGGSIVINQTEALVAIDINTGKFVGKTARLEDTIVKTNLDAIPEIVRQIRLRDLGGIIIIDFIDMDERKNRNKVMAALEEELKSDRAPSKVLQFNDFGLVAITRKRVKQSLERTLSTTCGVCAGTGMVKSPVTVCNDIYIEMRKMHKHLDRGDVMLRVHPEVVKQLKSTSSRWLQEMEEMSGKTILIKSDPSLHPEQFDIH